MNEILPGFVLGHQNWIVLSFGILVLFVFFQLRLLLAANQSSRIIHPGNKARLIQGLDTRSSRALGVFQILAVLSLCFALCDPRFGFHWQEDKSEGLDLVIALDISQSMLATDVKPNRLKRARQKIMDFVSMTRGDRIGLVAFAGTAVTLCPLTLDRDAFYQFLEMLDPSLIPVQGTNLDQALEKSIRVLRDSPVQSRAILLISDGEETSGSALEWAKKAKASGIHIFCLGMGSLEGSVVPDPQNAGRNLRDSSGNLVLSQLNPSVLEGIAKASDGAYSLVETGDGDLVRIVSADMFASLERSEQKTARRKVYEARYQNFVFFGLALLMLCVWLRYFWARGSLVIRTLSVLIGFVLLPQVSALDPASEFGLPSKAEKHSVKAQEALSSGQNMEAVQNFLRAVESKKGDVSLLYNLGVAQYKAGNFEAALDTFAQIPENAGPAASSALYNRANAHFRLGQLEEAARDYQKTLELAPEHQKAKANLELVMKRLQKQEDQKQNQGQDQQNQKEKGDQQDKQEGEKKEQKGQENQGQKNEQNQDKGKQNSDHQSEPPKNPESNSSPESKNQTMPESNPPSPSQTQSESQSPLQTESKPPSPQTTSQSSSAPVSSIRKDMTPEEARMFLNRLPADGTEQLKRFIRYKLKDVPNQGDKTW